MQKGENSYQYKQNDQHQLVNELKASQDSYQTLFHSISDAIYVLDSSGRILDVNQGAVDMYGYARSKLIGQASERVTALNRVDLAEIRRHFDHAFAGQTQAFECWGRRKSGEAFPVDIKLTKAMYFGQEVILAVARDITQRKLEIEALEESQRLNEFMLDGMADIIGLQNAEHDIVKYNAAGYKFLSLEPEQAKGKKCFQLINSAQQCVPCATALALKSKVPEEVEKYMADRDIWLACRSIPILDDQDNVVYIVEQLRDITKHKRAEVALRQSEAKFRSYVDQSLDGIFILDNLGKFLEVNPAGCQLLGYSAQELLTMQLGDILLNNSDNVELCKAQHRELLNHKKIKGELRCVRKTGEIIMVEVYSVVLGENRNMGIARDITDRKKMEEEILKARKIESIGILAGGIAHDFNNILTVIMGNVSLAKMRLDSADKSVIARILGDVERASSQAKDLIQQLLTFAKGGAPIKQISSIAELLKDTATFALRGSGVRCNFHFPDYLWPVEFDSGQISQVINNLIINANQAMPEGGILQVAATNIILTAGQIPPLKAGEYVKISIADQGIGISAEYLTRIFDPYFTTKQKGSGLGLATAYSIISKHDGYITVESEMGKGSTFYIYLPAAPNEVIPPKLTEENLQPGKGKILLMDDEPEIREVVKAMLNQLGYQGEVVSDGTEAIAVYLAAKEKNQPFRAVIMDLTVPGGMGGKRAIEKIKEFDPQVKAIVSSGYSNDPVMANFQAYGFSGVLTKPYKLSELGVILNNILKS